MIGIIDVGIGNVGSLQGALYSQGWDVEIIDNASKVKAVTHLILPGVGSFSNAMERLQKAEFINPILQHIEEKKPLMGICLGMQLLANTGLEGGKTRGLGLIDGQVVPFKKNNKFRLPHVGWNVMHVKHKHPIIKNIKIGVDFYFVHSYFFNLKRQTEIIGSTNYIIEYPSFVAKNNIVGIQFHPEKSQRNGLQLLDNFCLWDGKC